MQKSNIKTTLTKEIEQIRLTATSPAHLIELLQAFWSKYGIKVAFKTYPNSFSLYISNSHNSPDGYKQNWAGRKTVEGIPTGYPGWCGVWEGDIEILDSCEIAQKNSHFSTLTGTWSSSIMNVWYIQTGTGSGGTSFRYDGMLWLYDFPLMRKQMETKENKLEILKNEYRVFVDEYRKVYSDERHAFVTTEYPIKTEYTAVETLKHKEQTEEYRIQQFDNVYQVKLPSTLPTFTTNNPHLKNTCLGTTIHPSLRILFYKIEDISKQIDEHIDKYPELLF